MRFYCSFQRPPSFEKARTWRRTWSSWIYEAAYPSFGRFWKKAEDCPFSRCSIYVEDCDIQTGRRKEALFRESALFVKIDDLYEILKHRPIWDEQDKACTPTVRLLQIMDLSPAALICLMGSTPRFANTTQR
jgi:hypothetical protein